MTGEGKKHEDDVTKRTPTCGTGELTMLRYG